MALLTMAWRSGALGKSTKTVIYVNDAAKPPYPVYYLLHGLSDDETNWSRGTQLETHAARWPFLIVMPDAERSFYCDHPGGAFETLVARELVERIDNLFPTRREARHRAVGGLSMGGYGALKLALKYPDVFRVGVSHSGALGFGRREDYLRFSPGLDVLLGAAAGDAGNRLFDLSAAAPKSRRPALSIDCGDDDYLLADNEEFHRHLDGLGYAHEYNRFPGGHCWPYWNARLPGALAFVAGKMRVKSLG